MPVARPSRHRFEFDGGTVALDFVNTVSGMRATSPTEWLIEFGDLVDWAEQAGLLDARAAARLYAEAPGPAAKLLVRAKELREALYHTVRASLQGHAPPAAALAVINGWIAEAMAARRLHATAGGAFEARFDEDGAPLSFLRPVALDAAELLERELGTGRVRVCDECEYDRCDWLFLDQTKNASRRFCSTSDCGNRAKQRRFQARRRSR
jgi:predicted RNA-binding Zn ribbon-like protein